MVRRRPGLSCRVLAHALRRSRLGCGSLLVWVWVLVVPCLRHGTRAVRRCRIGSWGLGSCGTLGSRQGRRPGDPSPSCLVHDSQPGRSRLGCESLLVCVWVLVVPCLRHGTSAVWFVDIWAALFAVSQQQHFRWSFTLDCPLNGVMLWAGAMPAHVCETGGSVTGRNRGLVPKHRQDARGNLPAPGGCVAVAQGWGFWAMPVLAAWLTMRSSASPLRRPCCASIGTAGSSVICSGAETSATTECVAMIENKTFSRP